MAKSWQLRLRYLLSASLALLFCLPLYWGFVASLRPLGLTPARTVAWWPADPAWGNYRALFDILPFARYTANSLWVVAFAVPLTALIASLAAFGLSQIDDERARQRLVQFNLLALLIPASAIWIFRFQMLKWLGLIDSLWALILPAFAASSPLFVLLFYWGFLQIPAEMFEAARLEGAAPLKLWWRLALPLALPSLTGVAVLAFLLYWGDFVSPVLFIYNPRYYTLPVGLQILKQMDVTNTPLLMAAAIWMTLPVLASFWFLQRYFLHELSLANLFDRS
jgi:multiple sugar transport system permease protein